MTDNRVNTTTASAQGSPSVAIDADGDFVVTWHSYGQDGSSWGIYAQRYNAGGIAQGTEFRVNTTTGGAQGAPSVAIDADGDFVVTWQSYGQDGSTWGVYAKRYNASGVAQDNEFRVNTTTTGAQYTPMVAIDADGDFVVTWTSFPQDGSSYGVYAQRYNASGVAQGSEFRVNSTTSSAQRTPSVAMDTDGDFVITWQSNVQDGNGYGVYAQRYNASGVAQGAEFRVNSTTTYDQSDPSVAIDADGDFVVTWISYRQDGSRQGIYAQRYNASGVAQGTEFQVNTYTTSAQSYPSIAMDSDGDFVVTWQSNGQDGSLYGVYAQRYNASGVAQGTEFQVNTYATDYQEAPSVATDATGNFVVA